MTTKNEKGKSSGSKRAQLVLSAAEPEKVKSVGEAPNQEGNSPNEPPALAAAEPERIETVGEAPLQKGSPMREPPALIAGGPEKSKMGAEAPVQDDSSRRKLPAADGSWPRADLDFMSAPTAPAPALPMEVLPARLRMLTLGFCEARKLPSDYVFGAILGACAGTIGNRVRLVNTDGELEALSVFVIEVGPPSVGKSAAMRVVQTPILAIESEMTRAHTAMTNGNSNPQLDKFDKRIHEAVARRLALEEGLATQDEAVPTPPGLMLSEFTGAGLLDELRSDRNGRLILNDEISGAFAYASANQGHRARTLLLKGFDGVPHTGRSKVDGRVHVPAVMLSMLGATQPARLRALIDAVQDGLAARVWWFYPDVAPTAAMAVEPGPTSELKALLTKLVALAPAGGDGPEYSAGLPLAPDTMGILQSSSERWVGQMRLTDGPFRDALGRAAQYARRLAAILAIVEHAGSGRDGLPARVERADVEAAVAIVDRYLLPMAERVLGAARTPRESDAARLVRFLARMGLDVVNVRADIHRAAGSPVRDPEAVAEALEELRLRHIVRPVARNEMGPGRPSICVEVNPAIFEWGKKVRR
jgi:hypothetical protein